MYLFILICFKFFLIKTSFEQISFRAFWIKLCKSCKIKLYDIIAAIIDFPLTYNFSEFILLDKRNLRFCSAIRNYCLPWP